MSEKANIDANSTIEKITRKLQEIGEEIKQDETLSLYDRLINIEVVLNTLRFIQDYDENVSVLNKYWLDKRRQQKFQEAQQEDGSTSR